MVGRVWPPSSTWNMSAMFRGYPIRIHEQLLSLKCFLEAAEPA